MAYFNHAFTKIFLGTSTNGDNTDLENGFIITAGLPTSTLSQVTPDDSVSFGPGTYGFFDPKTWNSVDETFVAETTCCPLILASASLLSKDKLGKFHGGYQESNKSKIINPKYIQRAYRVDSCVPQQSVTSIGVTPQTVGNLIGTFSTLVGGTNYNDGVTEDVALTGGTGAGAVATITVVATIVTEVVLTCLGAGYTATDVLTISGGNNDATVTVDTVVQNEQNNFQSGTVQANCPKEFTCGETYYLRVDVKGSPALRALNHNAYQNVSAYTGCCPADTLESQIVDPTLVYIEWAKGIVESDYLNGFVAPVVYDTAGVAWYAPGTTSTYNAKPKAITPAEWWTEYASPVGPFEGLTAGMRLFGAYVDTKFGNCSFQCSDFFEKEPVRVYASLVDLNGDPCEFEGLCVYNDCLGLQGMGFGEQVVRDLILSESYLQNFFSTDIRIREITQGDQILGSVDRNALYTRYFLLHSVPRFNNPSGTFDNDRYMLEIITTDVNKSLETFLNTWLDTCANCVTFETETCSECCIIADPRKG